GLAAETARRGRHEVALQALPGNPRAALQEHVHYIAVGGISVGPAVAGDDVEIVGASDDALGEEQARNELFVIAGRAHRDAEIRPAQTDLEGLFDREMILAFRGGVITNLDDPMTDGRDTARDFKVGVKTHRLSHRTRVYRFFRIRIARTSLRRDNHMLIGAGF